MPDKEPKPLSVREKLTIIIAVFIIKMLGPWDYSHQFDKFWEDIKEQLKS